MYKEPMSHKINYKGNKKEFWTEWKWKHQNLWDAVKTWLEGNVYTYIRNAHVRKEENLFRLSGHPNLIIPFSYILLDEDVEGLAASFQKFFGWDVFRITFVNNRRI